MDWKITDDSPNVFVGVRKDTFRPSVRRLVDALHEISRNVDYDMEIMGVGVLEDGTPRELIIVDHPDGRMDHTGKEKLKVLLIF